MIEQRFGVGNKGKIAGKTIHGGKAKLLDKALDCCRTFDSGDLRPDKRVLIGESCGGNYENFRRWRTKFHMQGSGKGSGLAKKYPKIGSEPLYESKIIVEGRGIEEFRPESPTPNPLDRFLLLDHGNCPEEHSKALATAPNERILISEPRQSGIEARPNTENPTRPGSAMPKPNQALIANGEASSPPPPDERSLKKVTKKFKEFQGMNSWRSWISDASDINRKKSTFQDESSPKSVVRDCKHWPPANGKSIEDNYCWRNIYDDKIGDNYCINLDKSQEGISKSPKKSSLPKKSPVGRPGAGGPRVTSGHGKVAEKKTGWELSNGDFNKSYRSNGRVSNLADTNI
jgi:hypothetical protein